MGKFDDFCFFVGFMLVGEVVEGFKSLSLIDLKGKDF